MNQKFAFLVAGVLTAFLLVIGGGLAGRLTQSAAVPVAAAAAAEAAPAAQIDLSSQIIAQMQQREADYQHLIDQANQRLQQAYDQQKAAVAQINQTRSIAAAPRASQPAAAVAQPAGPMLSAESALNIAIDASGGKRMTREPQLVLYEGAVAYEIGFTNGAIYIDANSGAVLYNGVTAPHASNGSTVAQQQPPSNPPSGDHEDEHDDEHDD
jgi:uncharacterized membrane protein YkoI